MSLISTNSIDYVSKTFQLSDGSVYNCFIYDTCGQEKFNALNESYSKNADAALLVYDISARESFITIKDYYCPTIKRLCKTNIPIILIGNKVDKENERKVSTDEGIKLAIKENFIFKESSCLKNENVAGAFEALIELWNNQNNNDTENIMPVERRRSKSVIDKVNDKNSDIDQNKMNYSFIRTNTFRLKKDDIIKKNTTNSNKKNCC